MPITVRPPAVPVSEIRTPSTGSEGEQVPAEIDWKMSPLEPIWVALGLRNFSADQALELRLARDR